MVGMGIGVGIGRQNSSVLAAREAFEKTKFELLLQTQILKIEKNTNEGSIISAVSIPWFAIYNALERYPDLLYSFSKSPEKFEEFIASSYEREGWNRVILTPRSGDGGRDVIAEKRGFGSIRILDQCKAFSKGHLVGQNDVRAIIGVLNSDSNASKAVLTTTSNFAPGVLSDSKIQQFVPYRLELRDGSEVMKWLSKIRDNSK
jgi:restriction system protein